VRSRALKRTGLLGTSLCASLVRGEGIVDRWIDLQHWRVAGLPERVPDLPDIPGYGEDEDQDQTERPNEECEPIGVGEVLDDTPGLFEEVA
jgi:hypothetical protein